MRNLARNFDKKDQIGTTNAMCEVNPLVAAELIEAGITVFKTGTAPTGEVPTDLIGRLGGWEFTRAWTYWVARGRMPIAAARALYAAGNRSIRCGGDCTVSPPDEHKTYIAVDGREIATAEDMGSFADYHVRWPSKSMWHPDVIAREYVQESEAFPRDDSTAYVTMYHIDTPDGLKRFADFVLHQLARLPVRLADDEAHGAGAAAPEAAVAPPERTPDAAIAEHHV